jgi:hypothetical protein
MIKFFEKSFILFCVIVFFLLIVSCSNGKEKECKIHNNPNSVRNNLKIIFMDTIYGEYPKIDRIHVHYDNIGYDEKNIIYHLYYILKDDTIPDSLPLPDYEQMMWFLCPITFKIEITKNLNYEKVFLGWQDSNVIDFLIAKVWVTDKDCNEFQKISVPFYKNIETDSSYILTTQVIVDNKFVVGYPIIFLDNETTPYLNQRSYGRHLITFIPVNFGDLTKINYYNSIQGHIKAEIDLIDYKDTLETIIDFCSPFAL